MKIGKLIVQTHYDHLEIEHEKNSGESIVDAAGYLSPKQRIMNLMRAGERLDQWRREQYDLDHQEEDDGIWMDEMRQPGLDLSDVSRIQERSLERLRARKSSISKKSKSDVENGSDSEANKEPKETREETSSRES